VDDDGVITSSYDGRSEATNTLNNCSSVCMPFGYGFRTPLTFNIDSSTTGRSSTRRNRTILLGDKKGPAISAARPSRVRITGCVSHLGGTVTG
jgi:hypothetical protein